VSQVSAHVGESTARHFGVFLRSYGRICAHTESPIEAVFWSWWQALTWEDDHLGGANPGLILETQVSVTTADGSMFRLDFVVQGKKIAIELDGHDFHERTPEQVAHRNLRDRKLQADGWLVFHISGSELFRQPLARVKEVYEMCRTARGL
jgi:very-short-patch-repair endonuclease